jgi:DNA-directed DNA polymerase III PolC
MGFIHLHVHSPYSFLDGASTLDRLLEKAGKLNMPAMALTDHNRLTGAVRFYDKSRALGIKPIIGAEVDLENGCHLTLLCRDDTGYSNLCRLLTTAHLSRPDHQPAATDDMLIENHEGLIALSGCNKGKIPSLITAGHSEQARQAAGFYKELFKDDFFIELTRYPAKDSGTLDYRLAELAAGQGVPVVATNNVHYADMKDYRIKELLNAIDQNTGVSQLTGYRTVEQYLKSTREMAKLFHDLPQAVAMTEEIADRCNLELELGKPHFPKFEIPEGESSAGYLSRLAYDGARRKYPALTNQVTERLELELETIRQLGFGKYFLVVWDIMRRARELGIRCQARGSAVDSLVVYTLDISNVDPMEYNLLFERFMHPLRHEPPDIDLDVDRERRDEVRDYIYGKYGADNVSCVSTINTYQARGAIRDAGKAMGLPKSLIEELCRGIHYLSVEGLLENAGTLPELRGNTLYKAPYIDKFLKLCAAIDGFPKHLSVHLGGLLIGERKLCQFVPVERSSGGDIISQYDKDDVERLGLVKIDLLALPTLTVIEDTVAAVRENRGLDIDIDSIPRNDPEAFAMLRDGKTVGTFQLESPAQREMAGRLLPDCFEDIIVSISLVRPGPLKSNMDKDYLPRRHGTAPVAYLHPRLKDALGETLGVILYQEQVLKVAHDLAGLSYAEADGFRRAMTHDRTDDEMNKMREGFIASSLKNGVKKNIAEKVFQQLSAFAAYGFCKAHAVAYAITAYQTLWLKRHYPAEYFAAVLSNQPMGYYPSRVLIAEARRSGVGILPLDVNSSLDRFTARDGAIRIGFEQLKGISGDEIKSILNERKTGEFCSLRDFVLRTNVSQPTLESLVKVGGCDAFGSRKELLLQIPKLLSLRQKVKQNLRLFELTEPVAYMVSDGSEEDETLNKMLAERELLSLDLSAHPFDFIKLDDGIVRMKDLAAVATGKQVTIAGSVIRYQTPPTRNGNRVVYIILEDGTGIADVTVFKDVQEKCGQVLFREGWLMVKGTVQRRGPRSLSIIANELGPVNKSKIKS